MARDCQLSSEDISKSQSSPAERETEGNGRERERDREERGMENGVAEGEREREEGRLHYLTSWPKIKRLQIWASFGGGEGEIGELSIRYRRRRISLCISRRVGTEGSTACITKMRQQ